jgi:TolA-binding protein
MCAVIIGLINRRGPWRGVNSAEAAVFDIGPKGDKAAIALYKRALALAEMGRRDEAVAQLNALVKAYPKRQESEMAKQRIQEWRQTQATDP